MFIDEVTEKVLGIDKIWNSLDVKSSLGQTFVANREYYSDKEQLKNKYKELSSIIRLAEREDTKFEYTRKILSYFRDIKNTIRKLAKGEILNDIELFEIKYFLYYQRRLSKEWKRFQNLEKAWKVLAITNKENYEFYFEDGYSMKLGELRKKIRQLIKAKEEETKKFFKKIGEKPNDKFVVSKNDKGLVKKFENIKEMQKIKETFSAVVYEFSQTPKIMTIEHEIELLVKEKSEEKKIIRKDIAKKLKSFASQMLQELNKLGELDFLLAKSLICKSLGAIRPKLSDKDTLIIEGGYNTIFKEELDSKNLKYTSLNIDLSRGVSVITGSNMAGKTQTLRTIGFLSAMAQAGMFVPAKSFSFSPFKFIFFTTEDHSIETGFSTFAKEIIRLNKIIKKVDDYGLILIDEIAKGTNHTEAQALSYAIIEELKESNSFSIITTHLPGLLGISQVGYYRMKGLKIPEDLKEKSIDVLYNYIDYNIEKGSSKIPMDAINIAEMMGLDSKIINKAKEMLK